MSKKNKSRKQSPNDASGHSEKATPEDNAPATETKAERPAARTRMWVVIAGLAVLLLLVGIGGRWSLLIYAKSSAQQKMARFQYEEALGWLEFAEGFSQSDPELYFLKARIYRKTGRFQEFDDALAKARTVGLSETMMKNEKLLLSGQSGNMSELLAELENMAGGAEQFDPPEIYEAVVNGFMLAGRFNEAGTFIEKWQKDFPDDPNQRFFRAALLIQYGPVQNIEGAKGIAADILAKLTDEYPEHFRALMTYGDLLLEQNQFAEALKLFRLCEKNPNAGALPRIRSAQCLAMLGKESEAKQLYIEALADDPDQVDAMVELGKLQFNDEEYDEALKNLERGYMKRPWDYDLANNLARVYQISGRQEEAAQLFAKSKEARSKLSDIQDLKAEVDKGASVDKRVELGKMLLRYGNPEHGIIYIRSALDENRAHPEANRVMREYLEKQNRTNPSLLDVLKAPSEKE